MAQSDLTASNKQEQKLSSNPLSCDILETKLILLDSAIIPLSLIHKLWYEGSEKENPGSHYSLTTRDSWIWWRSEGITSSGENYELTGILALVESSVSYNNEIKKSGRKYHYFTLLKIKDDLFLGADDPSEAIFYEKENDGYGSYIDDTFGGFKPREIIRELYSVDNRVATIYLKFDTSGRLTKDSIIGIAKSEDGPKLIKISYTYDKIISAGEKDPETGEILSEQKVYTSDLSQERIFTQGCLWRKSFPDCDEHSVRALLEGSEPHIKNIGIYNYHCGATIDDFEPHDCEETFRLNENIGNDLPRIFIGCYPRE